MFQLLLNPKKSQWLVFALAALVYLNTIPNKWALDDSLIIHQNNFVKKGAAGIPKIFSTDAFEGSMGKGFNAISGGRYRPLTPTLFALQAELFANNLRDAKQNIVIDKDRDRLKDLGVNTWFPNILHFFNVLWYGLLCLVIYRTLLLLLQAKFSDKKLGAYLIAFATSVLYAVHPIHTEAVANIKGLDEILAMLGSVASLYFLLNAFYDTSTTSKKRFLALGVLSFTLALFSKESAVTFIFIIPLSFWFFTDAKWRKIAEHCSPLLAPLVFFLTVRSLVLGDTGAAVANDLLNDPFLEFNNNITYAPLLSGSDINKIANLDGELYTPMPFQQRMATIIYTWGRYLSLLVMPYPLTVDYYPQHIGKKTFSDITVLISLIVQMSLIWWALKNIKRRSLTSFGILYYFITFSVYSNLFFQIGTNMAERFMFIPSLGFCLVVISILYQWLEKKGSLQVEQNYSKVKYVIIGVVFVMAVLTINRNFDWLNNLTLFVKDIKVSSNSAKINTDLAAEYILKSNELKTEAKLKIEDLSLDDQKAILKNTDQDRKQLLSEAIPLLKKALNIHPTYSMAWLQMGNAYHFLGQIEDNTPEDNRGYLTTAIEVYKTAEMYKTKRMDSTLSFYKSICYLDLGRLMGQSFGDLKSAIMFLEQAKETNPKEPEIYLVLGTAYSFSGDIIKAVEYTKKSLELRPNDLETKQNLAIAYQQLALSESSKRNLLSDAEKLLLEVYVEEKKLDDNDLQKTAAVRRTLDLLIRNYTFQGKLDEQKKFQSLLEQLTSNGRK